MRRTHRAAAIVAGVAMAVLPAAGPAYAQAPAGAEKLKLEVAGDGATGVTIQAGHSDGRPLEDVVRLVLTAEMADGRTVGPLQLEPAGEGQGFYSSGPVLSPGEWSVTVSAPAPYTGKATTQVKAATAQTPPPPAVAAARPPADNGFTWWPFAAGGAAALIVAFVVVSAVRRRRSD